MTRWRRRTDEWRPREEDRQGCRRSGAANQLSTCIQIFAVLICFSQVRRHLADAPWMWRRRPDRTTMSFQTRAQDDDWWDDRRSHAPPMTSTTTTTTRRSRSQWRSLRLLLDYDISHALSTRRPRTALEKTAKTMKTFTPSLCAAPSASTTVHISDQSINLLCSGFSSPFLKFFLAEFFLTHEFKIDALWLLYDILYDLIFVLMLYDYLMICFMIYFSFWCSMITLWYALWFHFRFCITLIFLLCLGIYPLLLCFMLYHKSA